jgi:hypothetical protein
LILTLATRGLLFFPLLWSCVPKGTVGVLIEHRAIEVIKDGLGSLLLFLPRGATRGLGRIKGIDVLLDLIHERGEIQIEEVRGLGRGKGVKGYYLR